MRYQTRRPSTTQWKRPGTAGIVAVVILAAISLPSWIEADRTPPSVPSSVDSISKAAPSVETPEVPPSARVIGVIRILKRFPTGLTKWEQRDLAEAIIRESRRYGFDPELILAIITAESSFNAASRSPRGAVGLMQLLPDTAAELIGREGDAPVETLLLDPVVNVRLGVRYLAKLVRRFGDLETALVAYNHGPGFVSERTEGTDPAQDPYAEQILLHYRSLLALHLFPNGVADR